MRDMPMSEKYRGIKSDGVKNRGVPLSVWHNLFGFVHAFVDILIHY